MDTQSEQEDQGDHNERSTLPSLKISPFWLNIATLQNNVRHIKLSPSLDLWMEQSTAYLDGENDYIWSGWHPSGRINEDTKLSFEIVLGFCRREDEILMKFQESGTKVSGLSVSSGTPYTLRFSRTEEVLSRRLREYFNFLRSCKSFL